MSDVKEDLEKRVKKYKLLHEKRERSIAVLESVEREITGESAVIGYLTEKLELENKNGTTGKSEETDIG